MIFADIPFKIPNPVQMSTKTTREQVYKEIKECKTLFQVGCGSGSIALDFLSNGGEEASLLDRDPKACATAVMNARYNNLKINYIFSDIENYLKRSDKKFDAIVVSTAFLTPNNLSSLIDKCLEHNGIIIVIIKEDVINQNSILGMKEVIKKCNTTILTPTINSEDNLFRLIYKGIKN